MRPGHGGRWIALAALLASLPAFPTRSAEKGVRVESLGQPCRARQILGGRIARDRETGRELLALTNMNEITGAELLFIDFERDTGTLVRAPAGSGSWAIREVPGDRLIIGTFFDGTFMVYDLKKKRFVKSVRFSKEEYIWNLAEGGDGRIYGGTYPGGRLGALDLNTYAVEDCGAPAPPNLYLRNVSALPDGRILCRFIAEKPVTMLYDPAAKRFSPAPESLRDVVLGVAWNGVFLADGAVFDGKTLERIAPPFPTPPADKGGWVVDAALTTADALFLRQGNAFYRCKPSDTELTFIADIDLRGGWPMAATSKGEIVGVRGQDYFVIRPGDDTLHLKPIPTEAGPRDTLFLKVDDRNGLWGGSIFGQTLFRLDPKTRKAINTGTVCDAGGEVYDAAFLNGKVYAASYAGGDITEYDPAQPWDQWNRKNPRPLAKVGPDYIRPAAGIHVGPGGRLYSGWMAQYGKYGGALAITDPKTGKTDLIANPLGEQAVEGLAVDDRFVYLGTSLSANGLPNKAGESPRFGIFDPVARKPVYTRAFENASSVRALAYDPETKRVALAVGGAIRLFDTEKREFVAEMPADLPRVGSRVIVAPGDGFACYGSEKSLIRLNLRTGAFTRLAELPASISNVAVGPDGVLYVSCRADVYRITLP